MMLVLDLTDGHYDREINVVSVEEISEILLQQNREEINCLKL